MNPALLFVLMSLAAYRAYRLLSVDEFPPLSGPRHRLEDYIEERWGGDWADGIACPWCMGSWCAIATVLIVDAVTSVVLPGLQVLAVATVVGIIGSQVDS